MLAPPGYNSNPADYDTSQMTSMATTGLTTINPLLGAIYGVGSGFGSAMRKNPESGFGQIGSDIFNPSHGFFTALQSGDWKDAIPILGAINRKKRAEEAREKEESFDYTETDVYKSAETEANLAYRQMQEGIPEASMRFQEDMINRSGAAALQSAGNLRMGATGLGAVAGKMTDATRQLSAQDATQRIANRQQYYSSLANLREQQQYAANIGYADYVNNQAALLAQQSLRTQNMNNQMQSAIDGGKFLGNQSRTPKEYGGLGWFGQGKGNNQSGFSGIPIGNEYNNDFNFGSYGNIG